MQSVIDMVKGPKGMAGGERQDRLTLKIKIFPGKGGIRAAFSFCVGREPAHGTFRMRSEEVSMESV